MIVAVVYEDGQEVLRAEWDGPLAAARWDGDRGMAQVARMNSRVVAYLPPGTPAELHALGTIIRNLQDEEPGRWQMNVTGIKPPADQPERVY